MRKTLLALGLVTLGVSAAVKATESGHRHIWNPTKAEGHGYPWSDDAHLGDLPALYADADGRSSNPVLAPRLKTLSEIKGRSLMIHAGGDNHSDKPKLLGGGARMACGVIK